MAPDPPPPEGWNEYRLLVVGALTDLKVQLATLSTRLEEFRRDDLAAIRAKQAEEIASINIKLARLDVRSGLVGLIGGLIPAAVAILYLLLRK